MDFESRCGTCETPKNEAESYQIEATDHDNTHAAWGIIRRVLKCAKGRGNAAVCVSLRSPRKAIARRQKRHMQNKSRLASWCMMGGHWEVGPLIFV